MDGIIAPMVESRFGMKKFISAVGEYKTIKKPYLAINIETKNAVENIVNILNIVNIVYIYIYSMYRININGKYK